jgi:hypothetical protein
MNVLFQLLRGADQSLATLRGDGWKLESERNGSFLARHPCVTDGKSARDRLNQLGLLTSALLRIEFPP